MNIEKTLTIARREYMFNLKRPAFLIAALGTPVFFAAIIFVSVALTAVGQPGLDDLTQVGYVDQAGIVGEDVTLEDHPDLFAAFDSPESARAALDEESIDAYFVLTEDYLNTGSVQLYSYNSMPVELADTIEDYLALNIASDLDLRVPVERVLDPVNPTIRLEDTGRELEEEALIGLLLFPVVFAVVFVIATQITSGFLMSGLVEEKTNRVVEMLVSSVKPMELLAGKILGLGALGLTQFALWLGVIAAVILSGQDVPVLSGVTITPDMAFFALVYFVLGYFLIASIMAAIGAVVNSEAESRQFAVAVVLPLYVPYFFFFLFLENSNGTIPVILSLIPLTAPMAMMMRIGIGSVPLVEIALSIGLLVLATAFFGWMSAKLFRWGLLLYGKGFDLREAWAVIRSREVDPGVRMSPQEVNA